MTIDDFIEGVLRRGLSSKTATVYAITLRPMVKYFAALDLTLEQLTARDVVDYVEATDVSRGMRASLRSALKVFYELADVDGPDRAVPVPRRARMRCRALEEPEARELARVARAHGGREGLAVLLGLYCGLRRSEIATLRWSDLDDGWLTVTGKGATRRIPVHPVVLEAFGAVRAPAGHHELVFRGRRDSHCNPTTVWTWVDELSRHALGRHVTTHVLRHTALATALDATGDLRAVQEFAGHAKPETTAGYTRVTGRRLVAVAGAISYEAS